VSKPTESKTKLAAYAHTQALDRLAKEIAAREGLAVIEVYSRAADELEKRRCG
jgi:hypothetical protein